MELLVIASLALMLSVAISVGLAWILMFAVFGPLKIIQFEDEWKEMRFIG